VSIEAPKTPSGWYVGRGVPLLTRRRVWGEGCAPSPEFVFDF